METWRQKVGILAMVVCLGMVLAALWYCLFVIPGRSTERGGTLVQVLEESPESMAMTAWPGAAMKAGTAINVLDEIEAEEAFVGAEAVRKTVES